MKCSTKKIINCHHHETLQLNIKINFGTSCPLEISRNFALKIRNRETLY